MKLTTAFNWKMSIHFKQFQEDPILPFTCQKKKKLSLKGLCSTSSLEAKSCLAVDDEDLEPWSCAVLLQCLREGWKVTVGCSPAPLGKVTEAEGLCEEHSPLSIFLSSSCLTIYIFGEAELLGFFSGLLPASIEQKSCAVCEKTLSNSYGLGDVSTCSHCSGNSVSQRSWNIQATLEVQLSPRGWKNKDGNLIQNVSELKDVYWNSIREKVVSLWEIQLLINEGYLRGSVENQKVLLQILLYLLPS